MVTEKKARAPRKKAVRGSEQVKKPWDPRDEDGAPFEEIREGGGSEDYIWPECSPEDEDEL